MSEQESNAVPAQMVMVTLVIVCGCGGVCVCRFFAGHTLDIIEIIGDPTCLTDQVGVGVLVQEENALLTFPSSR